VRICFDTIHERDRHLQRDRQTDRHRTTAQAALAAAVAWQKSLPTLLGEVKTWHTSWSSRSGLCVSVCVCAGLLQCNHPIPLKLAITNGPGYTSRKNWLTFDGDAVPDTDSGSLFHFHHHCGIRHLGDLLAFLILTSRSSWNSATWLTPTRE